MITPRQCVPSYERTRGKKRWRGLAMESNSTRKFKSKRSSCFHRYRLRRIKYRFFFFISEQFHLQTILFCSMFGSTFIPSNYHSIWTSIVIASRKENSNKERNLNNNSNPVSRDTRSHHWIGPRIWPSRLTESRQWFGRLDEKWLGDRERNNCIGSLEPRRNYCRGIYPGGTDRCYQFIRGSQPTAKPLNDVLMGPVKGRKGREKRETRLHLLPWSRLDTNLFFFFFFPPRWCVLFEELMDELFSWRVCIVRCIFWINNFVWSYVIMFDLDSVFMSDSLFLGNCVMCN